jgi:hypothetical protein
VCWASPSSPGRREPSCSGERPGTEKMGTGFLSAYDAHLWTIARRPTRLLRSAHRWAEETRCGSGS